MNQKGISSIVIILFIIVVLAVAGGIYYFAIQKPSQPEQLQPVMPMQPEESQTQPVSQETMCDNYECLIAAASECQPISITISYSEIPHPLLPDLHTSGQTKYEIKKSTNVNECILIFSYPKTVIGISEKSRQKLLNKGMTNEQINTQLETMNKSTELTAESETTCTSTAKAIASFLTDQKKERTEVQAKLTLGDQPLTYTTSDSQKLTCMITMSRQIANTSETISDEECRKRGGTFKGVDKDGTACLKKEVDLGTVVGPFKINERYPQCCAPSLSF